MSYYINKFSVEEQAIVREALSVLESKAGSEEEFFSSTSRACDYFKLFLAGRVREVFCCAFLTNQHKLIAMEELFQGTIDECSVYAREVVKAALIYNAAAVVISHNHPSGDPTPSLADKNITAKLKEALDLVGVRLIDHVVVGNNKAESFAEKGLI